LAIIIASSLGLKNFNALMQKKMIVYNLNKSSAIDLITGQQHTIICDSLLQDNSKLISTHLLNNWNLLKLREPDYCRIDLHKADRVKDNVFIENNFIQFYDKRLALINSENCKFTFEIPIKVDYLILCGNSKVEIGELLDSYKPDEIIFDSSNSLWKIKKWKKECEELDVPYYSVTDSGAFQLEL
jgi:competence protein ComEC